MLLYLYLCPLTLTLMSCTSASGHMRVAFPSVFSTPFRASLWNFKTLISAWSAPEDNVTMEPSCWRRMHPEKPGKSWFRNVPRRWRNEIRRPVLRSKQSLVCTVLRLKLNFLFRRTRERESAVSAKTSQALTNSISCGLPVQLQETRASVSEGLENLDRPNYIVRYRASDIWAKIATLMRNSFCTCFNISARGDSVWYIIARLWRLTCQVTNFNLTPTYYTRR